jgi:hypothetical protein
MDFTPLRLRRRLERCFLFLFPSSLLDPILLDGYTCCCGSGAWSDIGGLGTIRVPWLAGLVDYLSFFGERVLCWNRVRGPDSMSA